MFVVAVASVTILHLLASRLPSRIASASGDAPWVEAGRADEIAEARGIVVTLADGAEVAIFRHDGKLSAVTNACAHQNGPLGEGRIIDGCITCPWHGYQYRLEDGCAPPPFTETLATYRVRLNGGNVEVDPSPLPPGTPAAITL